MRNEPHAARVSLRSRAGESNRLRAAASVVAVTVAQTDMTSDICATLLLLRLATLEEALTAS